MASLKDKLTQRAGGHMAESMGARSGTGAGAGPSVPPGSAGGPAVSGKYDGMKAFRDARLIVLDRLTPDPDQPRKTFSDESLDRLADSLRTRGMLQPIRVRWDADLARWVIVAGERRFRAARRAGLAEVPCVVVEAAMSAREVRLDQLIENALREDVPPLEQAAAFQTLIAENQWSARRLAEELHLSPQTVLRALDLLELPAAVRERVERGELAPRTAAEIATLADPAEQVALADEAARSRLSRDAVAEAVKARKAGRAQTATAAVPRPTRAEYRLDDGSRVTIAGPAAATTHEHVAALRRALKLAQERARAEAEAEADGSAAVDPGQAA